VGLCVPFLCGGSLSNKNGFGARLSVLLRCLASEPSESFDCVSLDVCVGLRAKDSRKRERERERGKKRFVTTV
jgi:hypothetical protein